MQRLILLYIQGRTLNTRTTPRREINMKKVLSLFLFFFKIGCFTFGGGWSILAQMEEEFIDKQKVLTKEELLDITSVGKSLPGIMITNISVIFGHRMAGIPGAIAATLGIVAPSVLILSVVTVMYNFIKDNIYVGYALKGIRAAVIPIIGSSVISLWRSAMKDKACLVFCFGAFILTAFMNFGNIPVILSGILIACILCWRGKNGTH